MVPLTSRAVGPGALMLMFGVKVVKMADFATFLVNLLNLHHFGVFAQNPRARAGKLMY